MTGEWTLGTKEKDDPLAQVKEDAAKLPAAAESDKLIGAWKMPGFTFTYEPAKPLSGEPIGPVIQAEKECSKRLAEHIRTEGIEYGRPYTSTVVLVDGRLVDLTLQITDKEQE